jgi:DNA-binding transcriptional regulator YiaG
MTTGATRERLCTECGAVQHAEHKTVMYPESGLDNVQLLNVPVWVCEHHHEEKTIPAVTQLHDVLAHLIIRKPAALAQAEIKFLRRRVDLTSKEFAARLGISPVHLSRVENGRRRPTKTLDLLVRLVVATLLAARDKKPFPADLAPLVDQLEAWDIGTHCLRHVEQTLPEQDEWVDAAC